MVQDDIERLICFDDVIVTHGGITLLWLSYNISERVTGTPVVFRVILNPSRQGSHGVEDIQTLWCHHAHV